MAGSAAVCGVAFYARDPGKRCGPHRWSSAQHIAPAPRQRRQRKRADCHNPKRAIDSEDGQRQADVPLSQQTVLPLLFFDFDELQVQRILFDMQDEGLIW